MTLKMIRRAALAGMVMGALGAPAVYGQTAQEIELEARLETLSAALVDLRQELHDLRAEGSVLPDPTVAAASSTAAAAAVAAVIAPAAAPVASPAAMPASVAAQPASAKADGNATAVWMSGYVKSFAAFTRFNDGALPAGAIGHDLYQPSTIPVGGPKDARSFRAHAKQSRFAVNAQTLVGDKLLKGMIEVDFQSTPGAGNQRFANAYTLALRRAFFAYDGWLFGQEWTNFQYVPALPETTDYGGPAEGIAFGRQAQVRYTRPISDRVTLSVAAENAAATTTLAGSAPVVEHDSDSMPDLTARLAVKFGKSEISFAGLTRDLSVAIGEQRASTFGWGASAAGKIILDAEHGHDLRFAISHGHGIGRYVGLNIAPDAILIQGSALQLKALPVTAGFAALRLGWTERLRSTFVASAQWIDHSSNLVADTANRTMWSASANLFYSPVKPVDFGIEYRRGMRELVSGMSGRLDRLEFAAKYSF